MNSELQNKYLRLFTHSQPALRAFVRRLVPTQNDATEVMQNTAITLWQKFESFEERLPEYQRKSDVKEDIELHFRRWAMKVARYETLSWKRDRSRDRHVFSDDLFEQLASDSEDKNEHLETQRLALDTCLKKLPEERRDMLLEAYSARNNPKKIAEKTGRTINAFYQWLHRMRLSLLKCVHNTLATEAANQ